MSHADDDRYAIARVTVTSDFGTADIARVLTGTGVRTAGPRESWQTSVWRQARRLARPSERRVGGRHAQVITPAPREEWRAVLAGDPGALPEHAPEWVDALCADGRYADASRYYVLDDGREFVLPLVARRGPLGLGGWLQCFPPSWGIGGLVGADADADVLRAVLADLRGTRSQRIALRPDPTRWAGWARRSTTRTLTIPRRAHVIDLSGGAEHAFGQFSKSARRGTRVAEKCRRPGRDRPLRRPAGGVLPALPAVGRPLGRAAARAAGPGPVPGPPAGSAEQAAGHVGAPGQGVRGGPGLRRRPAGLRRRSPCSARPRTTPGPRWTGTWSDKTYAGDLVQWRMIELACELGCTAYHLGESGQSASLAQFKEKFGARPVDYAELRLERLPWTPTDQRLRSLVKKVLRFRDV